ncbi:UNVERIFIED_CONTAM: hypothetical protein FKN15_067860 [Acipenser sinensis]
MFRLDIPTEVTANAVFSTGSFLSAERCSVVLGAAAVHMKNARAALTSHTKRQVCSGGHPDVSCPPN